MGAFLSTLGFNQPFFFTIIGIAILLGVTVFIVQGNEEVGTDSSKPLLGAYRHHLHKPTPHPYSAYSENLNSTHIA